MSAYIPTKRRLAAVNSALLSSKKMDWCTPQDFFDRLNEEFGFVRGRLRFTDDEGNASDPAPFPSMVVIYNGERVKNE